MKKYLILTVLLATTVAFSGCGMAEDLTKRCGGYMDAMCDFVFGKDPENVEELQEMVKLLQEQLEASQTHVASLEALITTLQQNFNDNSEMIEVINTEIDQAQTNINDILIRLVSLENEVDDLYVELIDPCGDHPGYFDEVILKLPSGELVAYFKQSGSKEFLSVLTDGNYQTTDQQKCNFTVSGGEVL